MRKRRGFGISPALTQVAVRVIGVAVFVGMAVLVAPVAVVAAYAVGLAWLLGWPPARLYQAAAWCLPMLVTWLAATAAGGGSWLRVVQAPYLAWLSMWHEAAAGSYAHAVVTIAPAAVPAGLLVGAGVWSWRNFVMAAGSGGIVPGAPAAFDKRQWNHQVRTARARISAPGSVPLIARDGQIVAGATIRAVRHRATPVAALPYPRMRSHQVVVGTTGTGKTTLLLRLWAGFMARGMQLHAAGSAGRPLLVVLDCKGGADSRRIAERARRVLRAAGASATAIWPDETALSLWALPPDKLVTTLVDMIEHGTGAAAFYTDIMDAILTLAVDAPCGPPASAADLLGRLDADWLTMAHAANSGGADLAVLRSASKYVTDIALRFRTLMRRLGGGLDGPGSFSDADAWYCILEGTSEVPVAEAQARALADMLAWYATDGPGRGREILLAVDEFSAVSRRLPVWQLYERARSLGLAVQVSAQSWQGLAGRDDERYRVAATADGGIWLLRTPHPEPVAALAGTRPTLDSTRPLIGSSRWARGGQSRPRHTPVVDPDLIRGLDVGQAAYIHRGGVTYVQVKRLVSGPAELAGAGAGAEAGAGADARAGTKAGAGIGAGANAGAVAPGRPAYGADPTGRAPGMSVPAAPPGLSAFLDEAFGGEPR
ncbi:MAG TPA: hypothetical protein VG253_12140 [Streptosporangiaceae bacterium]|nr:hypothetical protein [Streptosporangiaceae bacterium]